MLGKALARALRNKFKVFGLGTKEKNTSNYIRCDIRSSKKIINAVSGLKPSVIVHTAALSDVEYCEKNPKEAYEINALGTRNIARAAKKNRAFLIYLSSDYVFNGKKISPYKETDRVCPVDIYGAAKLEGERFIRKILDDYLIVRTSWLFGPGRDNFVTQILKRTEKEKEMRIVADKFGSPTYTVDLACAIKDLISLFTVNCKRLTVNPVLHISNSGCCSRYEFTKNILGYAGIKRIKVNPVSFKDFGWSARRPTYSVLDNSRFQKLMGYKLRNWQEALREYVRKI